MMQGSPLPFYFDTGRAVPGAANYPSYAAGFATENSYENATARFNYAQQLQQGYQQLQSHAHPYYPQPKALWPQPQPPGYAPNDGPQRYYAEPVYANQVPVADYQAAASTLSAHDPRQTAVGEKRTSAGPTIEPASEPRRKKRQKHAAQPQVPSFDSCCTTFSVASSSMSRQPIGMPVIDLTGGDDEAALAPPVSYVWPQADSNIPAGPTRYPNISSGGALGVSIEDGMRAAKALSRAGALKDSNSTALPSPPRRTSISDHPRSHQSEDGHAHKMESRQPYQSYATPAGAPGIPNPAPASHTGSVIAPVAPGASNSFWDAPPASYIPLEDDYLMPPIQQTRPSGQAPVTPALPDETEPPLCPEQQELVNLILSGRNVFYTGSAGCGKSTVLKAFTKRLRQMGKRVDIIAPTGRAALQVSGTTTWTYAGWTPNHHKKSLDGLKRGALGDYVRERLRKTDVLVIDEISMVENHHLERLNEIMKSARHNPHLPRQPAFGGVQVILTGDFCQLPPVKPFQFCIECGSALVPSNTLSGKVYTCKKHGQFRDEDKWAFRSKAWSESNFVHFQLTQVHRQSDQLFISMLQKCRRGLQFSDEDIEILMNHKVSGVKNATQLHAVRSEVDKVNKAQFERLRTACHTYFALDHFRWRRDIHPHLEGKGLLKPRTPGSRWPESMPPLKALGEHRFDECVDLKLGMLVVLLVNLDLSAGLCNGSQGTICGWETHDPNNLPKAGGNKGDVEPGKRITGDMAEMKEAMIRRFIDEQPAEYRIVDGMRVDQKKVWPRVRFHHNGQARTIYADCSITEIGDETPYSLLARTQIPLAPAWAMTIHKSQGMTLDKVVVNLSRAFEEGQVYVALSRARSLDGLKIEGSEQGLRVGLGGNREVQEFLRDKFGKGEAEEHKTDMAVFPPTAEETRRMQMAAWAIWPPTEEETWRMEMAARAVQ